MTMNKAFKNYLTLQAIAGLVIFFVIIFWFYLSMSFASSSIVNHIRNDLIIRDFKSVQFNLNLSKLSGFDFVEVYGDKNNFLFKTSNPNESFGGVSLERNVFIGEGAKKASFVIYFHFSLLKPVMYSLIAILLFSLITTPYILLEKKRILKELEEDSNKKRNEEIRKMALQMFHDIRSPLAALNAVSPLICKNASFEETILKKSIDQINIMANSLLQKSRGVKKAEVEIFDVLDVVKNQALTKNMILKKEVVRFEISKEMPLFIKAEKIEIERMLSNLLNNSIEAAAEPIIKLKMQEQDNNIIFEIVDNGPGIPEDIIKNIGKEGNTTKNDGNGLGLLHASRLLGSIGAKLEINSNENGTQIKIIFKKTVFENGEKLNSIVLVDDDELTRMIWKNKADKKGITFLCYKNVEDCLNELDFFNPETSFYIDNHIGDSRGVELAEKLHRLGYKNLYMATGSSSSEFDSYEFIKGVIGKEPPF